VFKVCVENYESNRDGVFACNIKIPNMVNDLEGTWSVEMENIDREKSEVFFTLYYAGKSS
jgi:hypothetical protein